MIRSLIPYALLAALAAAITWWLIAAPRIELAELRQTIADTKVLELQRLDAERVELIRDQQLQLIEVVESERRNRELLQTIANQSRAQSRALEELKRNDENIAEYFRTAVPAELGRLYQRTATTDPGAYRQPPSVPTNAVHSASSASAGD